MTKTTIWESVFSFSKHLEQIQVFKHPGASIDTKRSSQKYVLNFAGKFPKKIKGYVLLSKVINFKKQGLLNYQFLGDQTMHMYGHFDGVPF